MKHKNGHYRWFHTYGTVFDRNNSGKVEHVLNISLDVTDSVEATKKIEEQEYFIQQIADASPTILYLFNVEKNTFDYLNREIFYVLGYTPEEILAMGEEAVNKLYHPDDRHLLPERHGSDTKFEYKESMMQYECRLMNKKGDCSWFLVREIVFRKNAGGNVQQILGAALDINKRKEMERTLLQNSFQLEQSNSSLEEFAYVASHDLKEPLRKISTFGDRMAATQMEKLTDDGRIYLKKIVDASQRMQVMIDDLLSVSMISGNRSFENYSLQSILEDARQAVEFKIEQKGAIINSTPLPEANIVPSQFRQLFQNLLSNSLKFVREGVQPVINISYKILKPPEVEHLQLPKVPRYLQLEFEDNGIGFENEFAGKIFQIFHRLHGRSEYEGTGIGLAICKKIVEHHGGLIFANSEPGRGAKFTIILPG
jgi:PAS domain S-box-containing protein